MSCIFVEKWENITIQRFFIFGFSFFPIFISFIFIIICFVGIIIYFLFHLSTAVALGSDLVYTHNFYFPCWHGVRLMLFRIAVGLFSNENRKNGKWKTEGKYISSLATVDLCLYVGLLFVVLFCLEILIFIIRLRLLLRPQLHRHHCHLVWSFPPASHLISENISSY